MTENPVPPDRQPLLILGASTRAAAQSALRAGLRPLCADLFADEDLRAVAAVHRVADYPEGLLAVSRGVPPCPWMYTGALENHPRLLARISAERPLWGTTPEAVLAVRDPWRVQAVLVRVGHPVPAVRPASDPPPPDGRWMIKPLRGAAGRGIRVWDRSASEIEAIRGVHVFQQRIDGRPISAVFLAAAGHGRLIGLTRQLVGESWLHAPPFAYCGSIGPLETSDRVRATVEAQGRILAEQFGLRGLFGVDYLLDGETVWPMEVNPRYTASVEVLERAGGPALLQGHRRACLSFENGETAGSREGPPVDCPGFPGSAREPALREALRRERGGGASGSNLPRQSVGTRAKAVLFAQRDLTVPALPDRPFLADRPAAGSRVAAGRPVCTIRASGGNEPECLAILRRRVAELKQKLFLRE